MGKNKKICVCLLCAAVLCTLGGLASVGGGISGDGGKGKENSVAETEEGMPSAGRGKREEEEAIAETEQEISSQEVLPVEQIEEQPVDVMEIKGSQGKSEWEEGSLQTVEEDSGSKNRVPVTQDKASKAQNKNSVILDKNSEIQDKNSQIQKTDGNKTNGENASDSKNEKNNGKKAADKKQNGRNPEDGVAETVELDGGDIELPIVPIR